MPEIDGYEVCRQLKESPETRDISIIFLSALNDVFDKVKAFKAGGTDYISKPFQVEEVLARVNTHMVIRAQQKALSLQTPELIKKKRPHHRTGSKTRIACHKRWSDRALLLATLSG